MSILRLGAHKLPAAEVVLVQTLFRLFARGDAFRWRFVAEPPYDALLVDAANATDPEVGRMAKAVLQLTRMDAPDTANTLRRPIRADRLQEWLKATEHDLLDTRGLEAPDTLIPTGTLPAAADEPVPPQTSAVRFKLRRWPPAGVLRGDPTRIRMATLLSRRALSAAELARMSDRPTAESNAFLHVLQATGLVDARTDALAPPPAPAAAATAPATPKPSFGRGLIASIRRRLGVGSSAS